VELGGLDGQRNFVTTTCELVTRTRLEVGQVFYSVAYLHTGAYQRRAWDCKVRCTEL
jgi:hypothetical protein